MAAVLGKLIALSAGIKLKASKVVGGVGAEPGDFHYTVSLSEKRRGHVCGGHAAERQYGCHGGSWLCGRVWQTNGSLNPQSPRGNYVANRTGRNTTTRPILLNPPNKSLPFKVINLLNYLIVVLAGS